MASGIALRAARPLFLSLLLAGLLFDTPAEAATGDPLGPAFLIGSVGSRTRPAVARIASGEFVIAYPNAGGLDNGVTAQRFHGDGSVDGAAVEVVPVTNASVDNLSVAMDPAGDFVVAWTQFDGTASAWARRIAANGSAGAAFPLDSASTTVRSSITPSVAMHPDGSFVVAWLRSIDSGIIQYNLPIPGCLNGVTLEMNDPVIVFRRYNAAGIAQGAAPQIAENKPGLGFDAFLCLVQVDGTVSSLGPYGGSTLGSPVVAIGPNGNFTIAWPVTGGSGLIVDGITATVAPTYVSLQPYNAGGSPLGLQQIVGFVPGLHPGFQSDQVPRIARGAAGIALVWDAFTYDSATSSSQMAIKLRTYGPLGLPLQLAASTVASGKQIFPYDDYTPDVAMMPAGAVTTWRSSSLTGSVVSQQVNVQLLDSGGAAKGALIAVANSADTNTEILTAPAVVSDGSGNFTVFWTTLNQDGSQVLMYGRQYSGQ